MTPHNCIIIRTIVQPTLMNYRRDLCYASKQRHYVKMPLRCANTQRREPTLQRSVRL